MNELVDKAAFIARLHAELKKCDKATAKERLLRLIGQTCGHLGPDLSKRSPPVPRTQRGYLEWQLREIRRDLGRQSGRQRMALLQRDREIVDELARLAEERDPTPEELLDALEADLPGWSDREILAVHAEGLRRGIPGFSRRG